MACLVRFGAFVLLLLTRAAAATPEDPTEHAKQLFTHAESLYTLERYDEALVEYERAFELKPLPGFLYNIAQCHRQLGHSAKAAHFYRSYLDRTPRAPNRDLVRSLIEEMDRMVETASPPPTTVTRKWPVVVASHDPLRPDLPPTTTTATPLYKKWWLWTAAGALVAGGAVGVGVGVGASSPPPPHGTLGTIDVGP